MGMPGQPAAYPGPPGAFGQGPASAGAVPAAAAGPGGVTDPMALLIPTPFLCVTGMVTGDVLSSDEEYKEVGLIRMKIGEPEIKLVMQAAAGMVCTV